jgi:hypothetical protein
MGYYRGSVRRARKYGAKIMAEELAEQVQKGSHKTVQGPGNPDLERLHTIKQSRRNDDYP